MKRILVSLAAVLLLGTWAIAEWQDEAALTAPASGDEVLINDKSDTTDDTEGTVKRITMSNLGPLMMQLLQNGDTVGLVSTESDAADEWCIQIYDVDGTTWTDCLCFTNANTPTITLETGCQMDGIALDMASLVAGELNDTSDPHVLTELELKGNTITNYGDGSSTTYTFPSEAEGWNFIISADAAQVIIVDPNTSSNWTFNGTALSGSQTINSDGTINVDMFCYSTEAPKVKCSSQYTSEWTITTP